jgi:hypothetical protein
VTPTVVVETKFGPLQLTITSGDYVRVRHGDDTPFTVRGKQYQVSVGVRVPAFELAEHNSINKCGDFSAYPVVAPTIKAAIEAACIDAVRGYVTEHPDVLTTAAYERAREEWTRATRELSELLDQVQVKRDQVAALKAAMEAATPGPIKAVRIWLQRAEGPVRDCTEHTFEGSDVWGQAQARLSTWSGTAPDGGSVDKTDFVVTYADGTEYAGMFGLKRDDVDLPGHMRRFLLHKVANPGAFGVEATDNARAFMAEYEIGPA